MSLLSFNKNCPYFHPIKIVHTFISSKNPIKKVSILSSNQKNAIKKSVHTFIQSKVSILSSSLLMYTVMFHTGWRACFTLVPSGPGSPSGPSGPRGPYAKDTHVITQRRMSVISHNWLIFIYTDSSGIAPKTVIIQYFLHSLEHSIDVTATQVVGQIHICEYDPRPRPLFQDLFTSSLSVESISPPLSYTSFFDGSRSVPILSSV